MAMRLNFLYLAGFVGVCVGDRGGVGVFGSGLRGVGRCVFVPVIAVGLTFRTSRT